MNFNNLNSGTKITNFKTFWSKNINPIHIKGSKSNNSIKWAEGIDWILLFITFCLLFIGLVSIYSSSPEQIKLGLVQKQTISIGIGVIVMLSITYSPTHFLKSIPKSLYLVTIIILLYTLIFGDVVKGTKGWLRFASLSFQPAELAKLTILLTLAQYLSKKGVDIRIVKNLFFVILITIAPVSLIVMQPDIGSATVILFMTLGVLYWSGFDLSLIFGIIASPFIIILSLISSFNMIVSIVVASVVTLFFRTSLALKLIIIVVFIAIGLGSPIIYDNLMPHQKNRIQSFIDPESDPRGSGYNVWQSTLAVGSGGFSGKGYLKGTLTQLKYIPEQWTDFIFSVTAEEFGFIGGSVVVALQILLITRIFSIAYLLEDKFSSITIFGAGVIFFYHSLINIGMVIGIIPVMGIPLSFISYGGSSVIINLSLIGFCLSGKRNFIIKRKMI